MNHSTELALCCHPTCSDVPIELAPVPLCGHHLRKTYEFANAMVEQRWTGAVAETLAAEREKAEKIARTPRRHLTTELGHLADIGKAEHGYVYFILFGDRVKIGWSMKPWKRLGDLPYDRILSVIAGGQADERGYHRRFSQFRVRGEWFRAESGLLKAVDQLAGNQLLTT